MSNILVVDDKPELSQYFASGFRHFEDCSVQTANKVGAALAHLEAGAFDVVVTDLSIEKTHDGLSILKAARQRDDLTQVIVVTAYATPELSVEVLSLGAFDFFSRVSATIDFLRCLEFKVALAIRHRKALQFVREHGGSF
jgi:DNA-binding NtrC family response regulator